MLIGCQFGSPRPFTRPRLPCPPRRRSRRAAVSRISTMTADLDLDLVREAHPDDSGPPSDALESLRQSLLDYIAADSQPVRRPLQRRRRLRVWPATFAGVAGIVLAGGTALAATVVITSGN